MKTETKYKFNRGALATAISMSLLLTACGSDGGGSTPPVPGVTATPSSISLAEDTGTTFEVVLNTEPTVDVVISVTSSDLSEATVGVPSLIFTNSTGTSPWNVAQAVTVSGVKDDAADGNQSMHIALGAPETTDADYSALAATNVAATVSDVDAAGFTVSQTALGTTEGGAAAIYTITLNTMPDGDVMINVASSDLSEGTVAPATLTFDATNWNTAQTVTVNPVDDASIDGNLTYDVSMTVDTVNSTDSTGYSALSIFPVAVTNSDDDAAGFTVSKTTLSTSETGTTDSYTIVLNTMPIGNVQIDVASADISEGSVSADKAFLFFSDTNWQTPQTVTVIPVNDQVADGNQTYNVTMAINANSTDTTGYAALTLAPVVVTNADNDIVGFSISLDPALTLITNEDGFAAAYAIVLNTMPIGSVVIDVTSSDLSEGTVSPVSLTFDETNWQTYQSVIVTPVDDLVADGNQTYYVTMVVNVNSTDTTGYAALTLAPRAVSNGDDDIAGYTVTPSSLNTSENGSTTSYTVVLNSMPTGDVILDVTSWDPSEGTASPATLTFNEVDWQTPQTVTVTPIDDLMADGNQSYSVAMLVNASSTDTSGYDTFPATSSLTPVAVTNADDDAAGFTVSAATLSTSENGGTTSYTVVLNSMPTGNVVIDVFSVDASEGTVSPAQLVFNEVDWQTPQTVTVTPIDDWIIDGSQTYNIDMRVNGSSTLDNTGYAMLLPTLLPVTNADDDTAGLTVSVLSVTTAENWTPVSYTIALNTQPDGDVVLNITSDNVAEGTVSPATLTFDSVNWATPQTVTVSPVDDVFVDGSVSYWITTVVDGFSTLDSTGYSLLPDHLLLATNNNDDTSDGTVLIPAVLSYGIDVPYLGTVAIGQQSYYEITGLTAGTSYEISFTELSYGANLYVYGESSYAFGAMICSADVWAGYVCNATPGGTSLWVRADGFFNPIDSTYKVNAIIAPLVPNYSSVNMPLALVDSGTVTDTLTATLAPASLTQIEVLVDLTHSWDSDLVITLISPAGTRVLLSNGNGSDLDNYTNTTFSDSATTNIWSGSAPFSGWFIPEEALSILNGEDGNGIWSLEIADNASGDTGELVNWGIKLQ